MEEADRLREMCKNGGGGGGGGEGRGGRGEGEEEDENGVEEQHTQLWTYLWLVGFRGMISKLRITLVFAEQNMTDTDSWLA